MSLYECVIHKQYIYVEYYVHKVYLKKKKIIDYAHICTHTIFCILLFHIL